MLTRINKTFRIFLSSTFSDMATERELLHSRVFPVLKELCLNFGCRFQVVDLRWGVREEAALDQRTMEICLEEIKRCQKVTPRPNFIILLGDRYGWRPLPFSLPMDMFIKILSIHLTDQEKELLASWYVKDDNAVPAVYRLKPRVGVFIDNDNWSKIEKQLQHIFEKVKDCITLTPSESLLFDTSATEQEIFYGALAHLPVIDPVYCYFRNIVNIEKHESLGKLVDLDDKGSLDQRLWQKQKKLKSTLRNTLKGNCSDYNVNLKEGGFEESYYTALCHDVLNHLKGMIQSEIDKMIGRNSVETEIINHENFCFERTRHFSGRNPILTQIKDYLLNDERYPLVITGQPGYGKTSLIAQSIMAARHLYNHAAIIFRFIGLTPDSSDIRTLLTGMNVQISNVYGLDITTIPFNFTQLEKELQTRILHADENQPLIIFLDALDQLSGENGAHELMWLPFQLPKNVHVIVSTLPGKCLDKLKFKIPETHILEVCELKQQEGHNIITSWLNDTGRTLQNNQFDYVMECFNKNGSPLYLRFVFEEVKRWTSFSGLSTLPTNTDDMIIRFFVHLSRDDHHGAVLVRHSLAYIAASRNGLAEDELLDLLSRDKTVFQDFLSRAHYIPPENRIPAILWSRLYFDLEGHLTERSGDGTSLITFFHRRIHTVIHDFFLSEAEKKRTHQLFAAYYQGQKPYTIINGGLLPNRRMASELPYHQVCADMWSDIEHTLTDFSFAMAKAASDKVEEMEEDYFHAFSNMPVVSDRMIEWEKFWRIHKHLLLRGTDKWPTYKILLQTAWEHSNQSPISNAAQQWLSAGDCQWIWARRDLRHRPQKTRYESCLRIMEGHESNVNFVTVIPGQEQAISCGQDGFMRLWDLKTGRCLRIFEGHTDSIRSCSISPDGKYIVSVSHDCTALLWNIDSPMPLRILASHHTWFTCVSYSSDGKTLAVGSKEGFVKLIETETGHTETFHIHETEISSIAWCPHQQKIVTGSSSPNRKLYMWNSENGEIIAELKGHIGSVRNICFSRSGRLIATASHDQSVRIWDSETGVCIRLLGEPYPSPKGHTAWVRGVAFTPDESRVLSVGNDKVVMVWDVKTGDCVKTLNGHTGNITRVAVLDDGKRVVTSSANPENSIRLWNLDSPDEEELPTGHSGRIKSLARTKDGSLAASGSGQSVEYVIIWDLCSGKCLHQLANHGGWVTALAFSPDNRFLASGTRTGRINLWDIKTGELLCHVNEYSNRITVLTFSLCGRYLLVGGWDERVLVLSTKNLESRYHIQGLTDWIECGAFGSHGKAAVGLRDGSIHIWDHETGQNRINLQGHDESEAVVALCFDQNRIFALNHGGRLRSWDVDDLMNGTEHDLDEIYKKHPMIFMELFPNNAYRNLYSSQGPMGSCIHAQIPFHWINGQVTAVFSGKRLACLEKSGAVHTLSLLDIVNGNTIIAADDLMPGNVDPYRISHPLSRIVHEQTIQACAILEHVFGEDPEAGERLITDVQRIFGFSNEDRKDVMIHIQLIEARQGTLNASDLIVERSVKRFLSAASKGIFPEKGPLFDTMNHYINTYNKIREQLTK